MCKYIYIYILHIYIYIYNIIRCFANQLIEEANRQTKPTCHPCRSLPQAKENNKRSHQSKSNTNCGQKTGDNKGTRFRGPTWTSPRPNAKQRKGRNYRRKRRGKDPDGIRRKRVKRKESPDGIA